MKYDVVMIADTTSGGRWSGPEEVRTSFDDDGELRDNIAAWLQFDFVREIHIKVSR